MEKKLDDNHTRMLRAIFYKSWRQQPLKLQLYSHLPPITKTTKVRRTRHAGYCWRSRVELRSDVFLWTPSYGRAKVGRPTRTYIQQLCEDMRCSPEDQPEEMNNREEWRERVRDICAGGSKRWWVCVLWHINLCELFNANLHRFKWFQNFEWWRSKDKRSSMDPKTRACVGWTARTYLHQRC